MVREELHVDDLSVLPQAVQFDAVRIVDIDVFFLGQGKVLVIMKPLRITNRLAELLAQSS